MITNSTHIPVFVIDVSSSIQQRSDQLFATPLSCPVKRRLPELPINVIYSIYVVDILVKCNDRYGRLVLDTLYWSCTSAFALIKCKATCV